MNNKIILPITIFLLSLYCVYSATSLKYTDDWDYNGGTTTDAAAWGGYSLEVYADDVNSYADCICWDWEDDGTWDQCDCEDTTKRDDCKYYSTVNNLCNSGKCYINSNLEDEHTVETGNNGDSWSLDIDIREFRDCDNSNSMRGYYDYGSRTYWIIYPKKYDWKSIPNKNN